MTKWAGRRSAAWSATKRFDFRPTIGILVVACLLALYTYSHRKTDSRPPIIGKAWVIDGDTIEISGIRIRLEGIDAPEYEQTCADAKGQSWLCGKAAATGLRAHIRRQELRCDRRSFDRYKRVLAICLLPDGSDINASMVRQGLAVAYDFRRLYTSEESEAQAAGRGI